MRHGSLFSGIGGFDLAAEWVGWENVLHCEINEFGRKVLKYYWPNAISYEDITKTDFTIHRGGIDILTGGFPCQPFSMAGKRKGTEDERHLWPEMLRAIREIQPRWVVGENVSGIVSWDGGVVFEQVQTDLENEGYEVQAYILPACGVNAPHRRDRVWFVAYRSSTGRKARVKNGGRQDTEENSRWVDDRFERYGEIRTTANTTGDRWERERPISEAKEGLQQRPESTGKLERGFEGLCEKSDVTDTNSDIRREGGVHTTEPGQTARHAGTRNARSHQRNTWDNFPTQPPVCCGDDGLPSKLVGITFSKHRNESIKAYGNAIVPKVVYQIFKAIQQYETHRRKPTNCLR